MSDVSNRTIVALLAVALVVSVAGTMYSVSELSDLGGRYTFFSGAAATDSGTASLNITPTVSIILRDASIDFGSGYVNGSSTNCIMNSEGSARTTDCLGGWASTLTDSMTLENDGNDKANVTVKSATNATWIGGTGPSHKFKTYCDGTQSSESGSCSVVQSTYLELTTADQDAFGVLLDQTATDLGSFTMQLTVPENAPTGVVTETITFTASSS